MSAIAGIMSLPAPEDTIEHLLHSMYRRGPDGKGYYRHQDQCLLHTRLAIMDATGGAQPMILDQGAQRYVITFHGEIYNATQLRTQLQQLGHTFYSHSDGEVVLHAYARWKEAALEQLNGVFAFAILEEHSGRVFLARDRIGVRPLFYMLHQGGLLFASEIKTILSYPGVQPQLDAAGAAQILYLGPGREQGSGVFRGIHEIRPGHYAIWQDGKLHTNRYWQLRDRIHTESLDETAEHVRQLVLDSIRRQMISDVPLGAFLSGGLDSSLICAVCSRELERTGERLPTFSLDYADQEKYFTAGVFQPNSDTEYIRIMQQTIDSDHHWTVLTPQDLIDGIADATIARDLPGMADVDSALLAFCGRIRPHVQVILSGECADEIFGGYPWYRDPGMLQFDGFPWARSIGERAAFAAEWISQAVEPEEYLRSLYHDSLARCDILPENTPGDIRMKQMVNLHFDWFMQTLLDRQDRMSMFHGLSVRVPFCDVGIAEYLYGVPWAMKDHRGFEKGLLRRAMEGYLPQSVLFRKKSPFPKTHDPAYLAIAQEMLRSVLSRSDAPIFALVRKEALMDLLEHDFAWPWYGQLMRRPQTIVYMLQINYWLERYSVSIV